MENMNMKKMIHTLRSVTTPALASLYLLVSIACVAWCQDAPPTEVDNKTAQIEAWIEQLNESSLTKRRKAKEALIKADADAIPHLAKAALADKRELIVYSLEVLGTLAEKSPEPETRDAARITLEMLAESDQPSTAARAKQILGTKSAEGIEAFPGWDDPNSGYASGGGGNRSVSVSSVNGVKSIRVEEAGRITTFRDEARGAIRVSIQEGDKKKDFVARNLADLKKKDKSAHSLYEQHSNGVSGGVGGGGGAGAFAGGNMAVGGFAGGFGRPMQGFGNNVVVGNQANANLNADAANAMMIQNLEELKRRLVDQPEMVKMIDEQIRMVKQQ
jgi:hypothetical protein